MYATPAAMPFLSTSTFFAMALVRRSSFPLASAFGRKRHGVEKNEPVSQPNVQAPQKWQRGLPVALLRELRDAVR